MIPYIDRLYHSSTCPGFLSLEDDPQRYYLYNPRKLRSLLFVNNASFQAIIYRIETNERLALPSRDPNSYRPRKVEILLHLDETKHYQIPRRRIVLERPSPEMDPYRSLCRKRGIVSWQSVHDLSLDRERDFEDLDDKRGWYRILFEDIEVERRRKKRR